MAPVVVDPARIREFQDATAFYEWLRAHGFKDLSMEQLIMLKNADVL